MPVCPNCGQENPEIARFCLACATPLITAPERRRTATLLFCDMSGSTAMGERLDAESVRDLMFRYFHEMRGAIERHGGTVEKFIGDAVMAVFGVPVAHEDDALRAVRAAWEMRQQLDELNVELQRRFATRIALRIGVNTGEVVAGDASSHHAIVTGDAVNVAARLEQAAPPGEILLGELTHRVVREAVEAEPTEPLTVKGKTEPLLAYRLLDVPIETGPPTPRAAATLVGREQELARLNGAFAEVVDGRRCVLVTIVGEPGVGKSRLAAEFVASLGPPASVLRGRCLPYGEGITFWPIREMVREAAAVLDEHSPEDARSRIRSVLEPGDDADLIARRVAEAIGLAAGVASREEIAWAIRRWFEALAERGPLVLVVDDIQWAEDTLRDLLADLPRLSSGAAILVLCLARPELLDDMPGWSPTIHVDPLGDRDTEGLVREILGHLAEPRLLERITAAAGGNPLFAQEIANLLVEEGAPGGGVPRGVADLEIPPTLTMLLEARLDRLPESERAAVERGSVEGEVFHRGAVVELSGPDSRPRVQGDLEGLVRRGLLRPERAGFVDEAAFRFHHILVRDTAYRGIPKKVRARLHQGFAMWLEAKAAGRIAEYEEIVGYHLEQAYRYREALGPVGDDERRLGEAAAERLASAGRRALNLGDAAAAVNLLERGASLLPAHDPSRVELLLVLGQALEGIGNSPRGVPIVDEAGRVAQAVGDAALQARAAVVGLLLRMRTDPTSAVAQARAVADEAISVFEAAGDSGGLALSWNLLAWVSFLEAHAAETEEATERVIAHARAAGDRWQEIDNLSYLAEHAWRGPRPVEDALARCDEVLSRAGGDRRLEARVALHRAVLESWRGRFEEARALIATARSSFNDLGLGGDLAFASLLAGDVELAADDPEAAESELRPALYAYETDSEAGLAAALGESLYRRGHLDEAQVLADRAERAAAHMAERVRARGLRAKLLARAGQVAEAEAAAREALEMAENSDYLQMRADALMDFGEVLQIAQRPNAAVATIAAALRLYEEKGSTASAARARALLDALHPEAAGKSTSP
jgi:class 3 adenylate cyclase/tetratricopeptide (TPR) repeat protein